MGRRLFQRILDDEYITEDYKLTCKQYIVLSLVEDSEIRYKNNDYTSCELLEEAINMVNSDWKLKDRIGDYLNRNLKNYLKKNYEHLAWKNWQNDNIYSMEKSIEYLNKAEKLENNGPKCHDLYVHYYLYKASKEYDDYNLSNYLYEAQKHTGRFYSFNHFYGCFFNRNYNEATDLYNKSQKVINLKKEIKTKNSILSNLKYELNSIQNNINNIQSLIDTKNVSIKQKNDAITNLNNLANSLLTKGGEINNKTEETINEEKTTVNNVNDKISQTKDFLKEITDFEKQKREEIESYKKHNKELEIKNGQLMAMLTSLESKFQIN